MKSRIALLAAVAVTALIWYQFIREFKRVQRGQSSPQAGQTAASLEIGFPGCSTLTPEQIARTYGRHWGQDAPMRAELRASTAARLRDFLAGHLACRAILERQESPCAGFEEIGKVAPGYDSVADLCRTWFRSLQEAPKLSGDPDRALDADCRRFPAASIESRNCTYRAQLASAFLRRAPERCPLPLQDACRAMMRGGDAKATCDASAKDVSDMYCLSCSIQGKDNPCYEDYRKTAGKG
jgi:hypothetical protein